jgi:hypothetical protein
MRANAFRRLAGILSALILVSAAALPATVSAQAIDGAGSIVIIPVVVSSGSFATEITIYNQSLFGFAATVDITFYGAPGTPVPGTTLCTQLVIPSGTQVQFDFRTQCGLPAPGGSRYGVLKLFSNPAGVGVVPILAHARVANPQGVGFSVEAFPVGTFEGATQYSIGLKRQAAAPGYQTNCFVSALNEAVPGYSIKLRNPNGSQLGNTINGAALAAYAMVRYVDIFAAAGLGAVTDYSNIRAEFVNTDATAGGPGQAIVAFCTVQDNTSFGADFRVAKVFNPRDFSRSRYALTGFSSVTAGMKDVYTLVVRVPDVVSCYLTVGAGGVDNRNNLEMRIGAFDGVALGGGGGNNVNIVTPNMGEKGTLPGTRYYGTSAFYFIDVGVREGVAGTLSYGLECNTGNGATLPVKYLTIPDDF